MGRYVFEAQVQAAYEGLKNPMAIYQFIDKRVVTLVLSDGFLELLGYDSREDAYHDMDQNMYKNAHPDDVARIAGEAYRFATEGGAYDVIYRSKVKDKNGYRVIHAMGKHVFMEDGTCLAQVFYTDEGMYKEGAENDESGLRYAINNALYAQSVMKENIYDSMTGLPGMTYFLEMAELGRDALIKEGKNPVLLFFDLSGMKFFNKKYGFAEGDKLIRSFAKFLSETFGNECCCHIGGDHFAAFSNGEEIESVLRELFDNWQDMNGEKTLPVRVGIFEDSEEEVSAVTACDRAKFACDAIRKNYISGFSYYDSRLRDELEKRQYIITNIDRAIAEHWIRVYYQPIVRAVNGKVCDEEALARWIDPEKGFLSPGDFIPCLEDTGLIYKLDLYVLEQVLEKIRRLKERGLYIVPQSINLSRSDFDTCDIVEEIVRRVDAAGVRHDLITIEITESIIGGDFEFIKQKIDLFREMGFPVWMDDFGSGYSSLDVLQSVTFDLIKFDMSFMKRLDEGDAGKIILTNLMKMATSLGVDTVCEGVETEEQLRFLQAIGCSKLQGFYFLKPIPLDQIIARYENGIQIGFENPDETGYYDTMGRINLYDLSFMMSGRDNTFQNVYDTIPMGVIEANSDVDLLRYIRSNHSFRDFMRRYYDLDLSVTDREYTIPESGIGSVILKMIGDCREDGDLSFVDERLLDGSVAHFFARYVAKNSINGAISVAFVVLSVDEPEKDASSEEYVELIRENARLKKEADASRKIAELRESVSSLLTNMPAMTFSKDVATGKYLACNQYFADYAHKETPEGVMGLTDFEIFDRQTAEHFVEDDKKALSMDKPYIFFEDVPDAAGNQRKFQTTKLKFVDDAGRQCLLGLCQDVTDAMRIRREFTEKLAQAKSEANIDPLTGVKNKHAYQFVETKLNMHIRGKDAGNFALTVLDVNNLKKINDTEGHQAGDAYIVSACNVVCGIFDHSPVFRVGGDEFVVISRGEDYEHIDDLINEVDAYNVRALCTGDVVIACGMARHEGEETVEEVFARADQNMYENKSKLKK